MHHSLVGYGDNMSHRYREILPFTVQNTDDFCTSIIRTPAETHQIVLMYFGYWLSYFVDFWFL